MRPETRHDSQSPSVIHVDFAAAARRRPARSAPEDDEAPAPAVTLREAGPSSRRALLAAPAAVLAVLTDEDTGRFTAGGASRGAACVATLAYDYRDDPSYRDLEWILNRHIGPGSCDARSLYLAAPMTVINAVLMRDEALRQSLDRSSLELFALYEDGEVILSYAGDLHWEVGFGQDDTRMREGEHA